MGEQISMELHNRFVDALGPSAIRAITTQINAKTSQGIPVYSFAGGMPAKEYFPLKELREITEKIFDEEDGQVIQYAPSTGYEPLKRTLASFMKRFQVETTAEHIQIYEGSTQGLAYIARAFLSDGGTVVVEDPSYTGTLDILRSYRAEIIDVKMDDDGLNVEALEQVLSTHDVKFIYTIPDFQNPSGRVTSVAKRRKMVELAEKYNTFIVEDAPYTLLSFSGEIPPAIKSFDTSERVIYIGSVSKIMAPGMRVGWTVGSLHFTQQMVYIKMIDDLQVNNLAQRQVHRYLSEYDVDEHLDTVRRVYAHRRDLMVEAVRESFPQGTRLVVPEGGMFMWLELPEGYDAEALFVPVFAENIAFVPGSKFYAAPGRGKNCMRLNYATSNEDVIREKIRRMGQIISEYPVVK